MIQSVMSLKLTNILKISQQSKKQLAILSLLECAKRMDKENKNNTILTNRMGGV
jgi:hypothetical protein